jgi:hypothetical protein
MQLCIATSAKPKTAPTAALTFTNKVAQPRTDHQCSHFAYGYIVEQWTVSPNSPLLPSYDCLVLPMVTFSCLVLPTTAYWQRPHSLYIMTLSLLLGR